MDAWEVLRALEDLLCDFGWVGGRQVNKWSRAKGSREKGKIRLISDPFVTDRPAVTGILRRESMCILPRSICSSIGS